MFRTYKMVHCAALIAAYGLSKRYRRARNFGLLHPNCKRLITLLHVVLKFDPGWAVAWFRERLPIVCPCCGSAMNLNSFVTPHPKRIGAGKSWWRMNFGFCRDDFFDDVTKKSSPAICFGQLRRACLNMVKTRANIGDHRLDLISRSMGQSEQQPGLASMLSQARHTGKQ